jgi:hypothetical protein
MRPVPLTQTKFTCYSDKVQAIGVPSDRCVPIRFGKYKELGNIHLIHADKRIEKFAALDCLHPKTALKIVKFIHANCSPRELLKVVDGDEKWREEETLRIGRLLKDSESLPILIRADWLEDHGLADYATLLRALPTGITWKGVQ